MWTPPIEHIYIPVTHFALLSNIHKLKAMQITQKVVISVRYMCMERYGTTMIKAGFKVVNVLQQKNQSEH